MNTPEENQFDDLLRNTFTGFRSQPDASVWPAIQAAVRPQPPTRWQRLRPVGAGVMLGALLMGLVPHDDSAPAIPGAAVPAKPPVVVQAPNQPPTEPESAPLAARPASPVRLAPDGQPAQGASTGQTGSPLASAVLTLRSTVSLAEPPQAVTSPQPADAFPLALVQLVRDDSTTAPRTPELAAAMPAVALAQRWRAGLALDTALHTALQRLALPERPADSLTGTTDLLAPAVDTANVQRVRTLLLAEAAVLRTLSQRNDSLLRTLEETPAPILALDSVTQPGERPLAAPRPWALSVASDVAGGWGMMPGFDSHTTEKLRPGLTTSLSLSRQLTDKWRLRAGLGETVVRTHLNYQRETTGQTVRFDTTRTSVMQVHEAIDTTFIIRVTLAMHIEPRLNGAGQLIGYDTTYIPIRDTTFQVVISNDTLRTDQTLVTRQVDTWRERRQQTLRPEYRFWTLPIAGQYALLVRGRLRLGVSAGVHLLVFRGGTRPVWRGEEYTLQRVGPRDGPFRPVSLGWQGSADVEWRFGPRLSATVAPGLRGWIVRPERALSKATRPLPSVQVGLTWGF